MFFIARIAVLTALAFTLSACSGSDVAETPAPEELYRMAKEEFSDEDYLDASDRLAQIREEYPFSPYAVKAELMEADVLFAQEDYELAIASYSAFQSLHPFHEGVPYSIYHKGLAYMALIDTIDRDQAAPKNAAEAFTQLLEGYPGNPFAEDAKERLATCRDLLAQRELYVAKFYLRTEKPEAALGRLRDLIREYPETSVNEEALTMALELEAKLQQTDAQESDTGE